MKSLCDSALAARGFFEKRPAQDAVGRQPVVDELFLACCVCRDRARVVVTRNL